MSALPLNSDRICSTLRTVGQKISLWLMWIKHLQKSGKNAHFKLVPTTSACSRKLLPRGWHRCATFMFFALGEFRRAKFATAAMAARLQISSRLRDMCGDREKWEIQVQGEDGRHMRLCGGTGAIESCCILNDLSLNQRRHSLAIENLDMSTRDLNQAFFREVMKQARKSFRSKPQKGGNQSPVSNQFDIFVNRVAALFK